MLTEGAASRAAVADILAASAFAGSDGDVHRATGDEQCLAPAATFDLVMAIAVLEYVPDVLALVTRLGDLLSPNGRFLVTVPNQRSFFRLILRVGKPLLLIGPKRFEHLADQAFLTLRPHGDDLGWQRAATVAGLEIERVTPIPLGPSSLRRFVRPSLLVSMRRSCPSEQKPCAATDGKNTAAPLVGPSINERVDFPLVAFNLMSARVGGGLTYAISQTKAFLDVWPHDRLLVLTSPWNDEEIRAAIPHSTIMLRARSALHRYMLEQTLLARLSRREGVDVIYGIGNFLPLFPTSCRTLMTLQNPTYVGEGRHLQNSPSILERTKVQLSHASMRRAELVITISNSLEAALRTEPRLQRVKSKVILSGGPNWQDVTSSPVAPDELTSAPFLLSVANDYPHKRLDDIATAFGAALGSMPSETMLVFVGDIAPARQHVLAALGGAPRAHIVFLGPVSNRGTVKWLYERALGAVSASELEAFPLTPAEAATLQCPLVLSDIPPHREVASGAGVLFPKGDIAELARHMVRIAMVGRRDSAPAWAWSTSWHQNAVQLADAIREVATHP